MFSDFKLEQATGKAMYQLADALFPICRSITGNGVRHTFSILKEVLGKLNIVEVPTGTKCFDWVVPMEWNINDAYIISPTGEKIIDFKKNNLHVVGYSVPVDTCLSLEELERNLYSIPEQPQAIPYVTSYYKEHWGFCMADAQRRSLKPGNYKVVIDSTLKEGFLTYGELLIPGKTEKEILLSTYTCHPSMAHNEISGPVVTTYLAKWLLSQEKKLHYSYRIIYAPETIGSIVYISKKLNELKRNVVAGFVVTCVGDNENYSYVPSRRENSLADRVAQHVLGYTDASYKKYTYLERGSDERQYCSPGVDLPVACVMRTKHGAYPEYHTSLDDMSLISSKGLMGAYQVLKNCLLCLESNHKYMASYPCEPQLGKRGLYPTTSMRNSMNSVKTMKNLLAYCDGSLDLLGIADKIKVDMLDLVGCVKILEKEGLISQVQEKCGVMS